MNTSRNRRSTAAIVLAAALVIAVSACGNDDSSGEATTTPAVDTDGTQAPGTEAPDTTPGTTPDTTPDTAPGTAPDTTPDTTPGTAPDTTGPTGPPALDAIPVVAYFQLDERVAPVRRHLDDLSTGLLPGTLEAWLAGPTPDEMAAGYSTTVPTGTRLLSATFEDGLVTVDLSGEFASGGGTASILGRIAELVMTASTATIILDGVELRIDGEVVSVFSGEGMMIDGPLTIADVEDQLPTIVQYSVLAGDQAATGTQISGWADVVDAVVWVQVVDDAGAIIQDSTTTASCGSGCRGRFTTWLDLGDHVGPATLRLFQVSADDGSELDLVTFPFTVVN